MLNYFEKKKLEIFELNLLISCKYYLCHPRLLLYIAENTIIFL